MTQIQEVQVGRSFMPSSYNMIKVSLQVPDIMSLQRPQDLTLEEGVAAVVKFGLGNLFSLAAKV